MISDLTPPPAAAPERRWSAPKLDQIARDYTEAVRLIRSAKNVAVAVALSSRTLDNTWFTVTKTDAIRNLKYKFEDYDRAPHVNPLPPVHFDLIRNFVWIGFL